MNRPILACAFFAVAAATLVAQEASQSNPYEGTSNPPGDDTITTSAAEQAKPHAGRPMDAQQTASPAPAPAQAEPEAAPSEPAANTPETGADDGIVHVQKNPPAKRNYTATPADNDPDGDIVHPRTHRPGEIGEGTTIRVRLVGRLSTASTEKGEAFRSKVASDVYQGNQVLIPAGSEIDGRVVQVSMGHAGGHGSMRLRPDTITLPDGSRYRIHAEITGTPGSKTRVGSENSVVPDSRIKRDGIEYGGAVGGGAVTGAVLGGPVGALTGGLIGAGVVTAHLLVNHPQATLEPGTVLLFTLTEPLDMVPARENAHSRDDVQ